MKRIAVIGSLNIDYAVTVDAAPARGETVLATGFHIAPGGKGANQAFAASRMGAPTAMFGAVGNDANGKALLDNLRLAGVDVSNVLITDVPTAVALITVTADGDNSIVVAQNANLCVTSEYIDAHFAELETYDIFLFQLEIPLATVTYTTEKLKALGKTVILDPAPACGMLPDTLLKNLDYLKPNKSELAKLIGVDHLYDGEIESACGTLIERGVQCVLASLGKDGVIIKQHDQAAVLLPAYKVKAIDTTAAGDGFTAAFAYALANGKTIEEAAAFANRIASVIVQRIGAQSSVPEHAEISALWDEVFVQ